MTDQKIRVAIVGLGFGAEFIPIYQRHPNAEMYAICRRNKKELDESAIDSACKTRYTSYDDLLKDPNVDAVHINSPIADHAPQSIAALKAGKHVACTVPMATTIEECRQIVESQQEGQGLHDDGDRRLQPRVSVRARSCMTKGELGRIQFLRGSHQQDMDGWPGYWEGLPPMHYATHCVSPCLALVGKLAEHVVCHGSGRIDEQLIPKYSSPFAIETGDVQAQGLGSLRRGHAKPLQHGAPVSRELRRHGLEEVVRVAAGGGRRSGPSHQEHAGASTDRSADPDAREGPRLRGSPARADSRVHQPAAIQDAEHLSFLQGGGHGGSHPHLAHNFLMACLGKQAAMPDAATSVNWTMVGICAHQSALKGGEKIAIPTF